MQGQNRVTIAVTIDSVVGQDTPSTGSCFIAWGNDRGPDVLKIIRSRPRARPATREAQDLL